MNNLDLIIHQIWILKTLWIFTINLLKNIFSFIVADATLASDNPQRFRKNLLKSIWKLIITFGDKIRYEILEYDLTDKQQQYQHFHLEKLIHINISQEIPPSNQRQTMEQAYILLEEKLWKNKQKNTSLL